MQPSESLIEELRQWIQLQRQEELQSDLPDAHFADISLQFAQESLQKVWIGNSPKQFLIHYRQILENRFRRLTDEDSGEFGSGRDALGTLLEKISQKELELESFPSL